MTEQPEYPGFETTVSKADVAAVQGALDSTFNAHAEAPVADVRRHLRERLEEAGVTGLPDAWVDQMAAHIEAGEPVIAEIRQDD